MIWSKHEPFTLSYTRSFFLGTIFRITEREFFSAAVLVQVFLSDIFTRDDVVSQRLKFGSAFLWISWESKLPCFFKLSRIPSPSRKNGVILLAAISKSGQVKVMREIMWNSTRVGGHVRFQKICM